MTNGTFIIKLFSFQGGEIPPAFFMQKITKKVATKWLQNKKMATKWLPFF